MAKSDRHHTLLIYARTFSQWRVPALLIAIVCLGLAWLAPGPLADLVVRAALAAGGVAGTLLYGYSLIGPRLSYVQCRPTHLRVSTPLFRLAISYSRIHTARPVPFEPAHVSWSQESLVQPFVGMTMLALDLNGYPVSLRWLRLLLNPFTDLSLKFSGLFGIPAVDWRDDRHS